MSVNWDFEELPEPTIKECLALGATGAFISNDHYHSLDGISGSSLVYLAESNKHYDNRKLFAPQTNSLNFGSLVHTMVLEPNEIGSRYVVMPKFDRRTTSGKNKENEFIESIGNKIAVESEDYDRAQKMTTNVLAIAGDIVNKGIKERSLFCDYEGLILKCRIDIDYEETGDDYDLKTITLGTKDFSNRTLEAHIKKYLYHWAAALRNIVRRKLGKPVGGSYLIFVNTGPGHMVRIVQIDPAWIEQAEYFVKDLLTDRQFYLARKLEKPFTIIGSSYE